MNGTCTENMAKLLRIGEYISENMVGLRVYRHTFVTISSKIPTIVQVLSCFACKHAYTQKLKILLSDADKKKWNIIEQEEGFAYIRKMKKYAANT
jgi:hypothetical protein